MKEIKEIMEECFSKFEERVHKTRTKSYADWLYGFVNRIKDKSFCDEDFLYNPDKLNKIDYKNTMLLSYFLSYVNELAEEQRVLNVPSADNEFETDNYVIKIKDCYFEISRMCGQGSLTFIRLVEKPEHCYVVIN